jgi:hypothetical protein
LRLAVPDAGRWTWLVVTDDALTINYLSRRLAENLALRAKVRHEIVSHEAAVAEQVIQQTPSIATSPEAARRLTASEAALRQGQFLLDASDFAGSWTLLHQAEELLAQARRLAWSEAAGAFASRMSSPCCMCFAALPLHEQVVECAARPGDRIHWRRATLRTSARCAALVGPKSGTPTTPRRRLSSFRRIIRTRDVMLCTSERRATRPRFPSGQTLLLCA